MVSVLDSGSNGPGSSLGRGSALGSWARHFTLTVPLFTQVYKWVPAYFMLRLPLRWTGIPSRGEKKYSKTLHAKETEMSSRLTGHFARTQTLPSGPVLDRYLADTWPILQWRSIATYRPIYRSTSDRLLVNDSSAISRLSADYRSIVGR